MRNFFGILLATIWISLNEFIRNELALKSLWVEHYKDLGMGFPSDPINGAIWGIWSLCLAIAVYFLLKKFSWIQAALISWWVAFVLMWLVIGNMGVLPFSILPVAIPWSLLEALGASFIMNKFKS